MPISTISQPGDDRVTIVERNNTLLNALPQRLIGSYPGPHLLRSTALLSRVTFRTEHVCRADCNGVSVSWFGGNASATPPTSESGFGNPVEIMASIERAAGETPIPLWFGGRRKALLYPGRLLVSDPSDVWLNSGDVFYVRCFVTRLSSSAFSGPVLGEPGLLTADQANIPFHNVSVGVAYGDNSGSTGDNSTAVDPYAQCLTDVNTAIPATVGTLILRPYSIVGRRYSVPVASVSVIGDSISYGVGDSQNGVNGGLVATRYDGAGWAQRGLADNYPTVRNSITSEGIYHLVGSNSRNFVNRFTGAMWSDVALVALGNNDIAAARALGTIQADFVTLTNRLKAAGKRVIAATVTPRTTSSDLWLTAANQTAWAFESVRVAFNAWLRGLPNGINGLVDYDSAVCDANGKWLAPGAADVTGTTAAGSTTTVIQVASPTLTAKAHIGKVLSVTGVGSSIIWDNSASTITVSPALASAPGAAVAISIIDAYTNDGIHPTSKGHAAMGAVLAAAAPNLLRP